MRNPENILVIQTAFLGDVVLSLPIVQVLKKRFMNAKVDFMCIPATSKLLEGNQYISEVIIYDKRNSAQRFRGMFDIAKRLKKENYNIVISPHRSYRTSIIVRLIKPDLSIGFNISGLSFLYSERVEYLQYEHEIIRNLSLLTPLNIFIDDIVKPELFPSQVHKRKVDEIFLIHELSYIDKIVAVAPGSAWFTKRYPREKFLNILKKLSDDGIKTVLVGGSDDTELKNYFDMWKPERTINLIGELSILETTELLKRCSILLTNDSAPLHIANSVGTDVIALFGATIPQFGFYPYGDNDFIFETNGLKCRPCSLHGGNVCKIKTFDCMNKIDELKIYFKIKEKLAGLD